MGLAETLVDEVLTLLYRFGDDGETELSEQKEDHQKRDEHPEEESEVGRQY